MAVEAALFVGAALLPLSILASKAASWLSAPSRSLFLRLDMLASTAIVGCRLAVRRARRADGSTTLAARDKLLLISAPEDRQMMAQVCAMLISPDQSAQDQPHAPEPSLKDS